MNGGISMPGWYDITGLDDRASESCEGIEESMSEIHEALGQEAALGLPYSRFMLAGFSQGGAMSLFTGLQLPVEKRLAGVLVMSGYCPGYSKFTLTPGLEETPLLHCHGTSDPVVLFPWAEKTKNFVLEQGLKSYELKTYAGMGHTASMEELMDAMGFLLKCLPDSAEHRLPPPDPKTMSVKELKAAIVEAGLASKARGFSEKQEFVELLLSHQQQA
jgi:lysophospholipase II